MRIRVPLNFCDAAVRVPCRAVACARVFFLFFASRATGRAIARAMRNVAEAKQCHGHRCGAVRDARAQKVAVSARPHRDLYVA